MKKVTRFIGNVVLLATLQLVTWFVVSSLIMQSCAVRRNAAGQPIPNTALQWTIIYNAAVAKADRAVEQAIETFQRSGAITAAQARPIIIATGQVASASEAIRGITSKGTEASWSVDGPKIRAVLDAAQLKLPPSQNQQLDLAS